MFTAFTVLSGDRRVAFVGLRRDAFEFAREHRPMVVRRATQAEVDAWKKSHPFSPRPPDPAG